MAFSTKSRERENNLVILGSNISDGEKVISGEVLVSTSNAAGLVSLLPLLEELLDLTPCLHDFFREIWKENFGEQSVAENSHLFWEDLDPFQREMVKKVVSSWDLSLLCRVIILENKRRKRVQCEKSVKPGQVPSVLTKPKIMAVKTLRNIRNDCYHSSSKWIGQAVFQSYLTVCLSNSLVFTL